MTSVVSAQSTDNINKEVLFEKLGYTKEYIADLKANIKDKASVTEQRTLKSNNTLVLTNEDLIKAIEFGFTKQEIADFTQTDLDYISDKNADLVSVEDKYIRITPDGFAEEISKEVALSEVAEYEFKEVQKSSNITALSTVIGNDDEQTSWMKVITTVTKDTYQSPTRYYLKHSFEWLSNPFWALQDAIAITHQEYMSQIQNSEIFKYTFDYHTNDLLQTYVGTKDVYKWTADKKGPNGMAFKYDILKRYNDGPFEWIVKKSRGHMIFGTTSSSSQYTKANAYGHYTHTEIAIAFGIGLNLSLNSLSVTGATSTTKMTDTGVSFSL